MKRQNSNDNPWRAAALVSALGVDVVFLYGSRLLGWELDRNTSSSLKAWVIGGVLVGFAVGILTSILVVKKFLEDKP